MVPNRWETFDLLLGGGPRNNSFRDSGFRWHPTALRAITNSDLSLALAANLELPRGWQVLELSARAGLSRCRQRWMPRICFEIGNAVRIQIPNGLG